MRKFLIVTTILVTILHACTNKEAWDRGTVDKDGIKGAVSFTLSSAGDFTAPQIKGERVDVNDFVVKIWKGEVLYKSFTKYSEIPSVVEMESGAYTLEAGSSDDREAAFSQPIYRGKKEFLVESGKILNVAVVCKLANMKVSIRCSESFYQALNDDFKFIVRNDKPDAPAFLVFTKNEVQNGISGYFKPSTLTVTLQGTKRLDNAEILDVRELALGEAQDHHILNYSIQSTGSVEIGGEGVSIDYSVNEKNVEIVIPGEDETPVEPPINEYLPTIVGNGVGTPLELSDAAAADAEVKATISALNGKSIQSLFVEIRSPYLTEEELGNVGIPVKFDLANMPDTEEGNTLKAAFIDLGILDETRPVKGSTSFEFSIGIFMAIIQSPEDGSRQQHDFIITVKDSEDKIISKTLSIIRYQGN